ncbi:NADP-dependent oxidoreductase [Nocardia abscessus]|uniref:NADP-dependent oxidoreductase n=1 Tax=Nocardia abscessus TaxID=120957 RepID=UPI002457951D|nr:NADP-dependent oxidoreductase [Nocardia abscessus]
MRAIQQTAYGGPEVLTDVTLPRPIPGPGEVLVEVSAAGLNPSDWKHREMPGYIDSLPFISGWDVSGVVHEVGPGVALHSRGDEVMGMLPYPHGHGAFAEYVLAPARALVPKPDCLTFTQAAVVPLGGLTAWQALVDTAQVRPGERVLVHAAAGGVGHLAVQIAKARGAYVIGTASKARHDFLRELGVDEHLDYRSDDLASLPPVDVVVDTIGGDTARRSLAILAPGGRIVSLTLFALPPNWLQLVAELAPDVVAYRMLVETDQAGLLHVKNLVDTGKLRPHIHATYPLDKLPEAQIESAEGHCAGKIVIEVK